MIKEVINRYFIQSYVEPINRYSSHSPLSISSLYILSIYMHISIYIHMCRIQSDPDTVLFVMGDHGMTDSGDHGMRLCIYACVYMCMSMSVYAWVRVCI